MLILYYYKSLINKFYLTENKIDWLENLLNEQKKIFHSKNLYIFATLNKINDFFNYNVQDELLKSKRTMNSYELYCYCQSHSLNPSCYNTFQMYVLLTNALNEIFDYIRDHHLTGKELKTCVKRKLDAIQCSILSKQLESEMEITFNSDYSMYKNFQITLKGYRDLLMMSGI